MEKGRPAHNGTRRARPGFRRLGIGAGGSADDASGALEWHSDASHKRRMLWNGARLICGALCRSGMAPGRLVQASDGSEWPSTDFAGAPDGPESPQADRQKLRAIRNGAGQSGIAMDRREEASSGPESRWVKRHRLLILQNGAKQNGRRLWWTGMELRRTAETWRGRNRAGQPGRSF